MHKWNIYILNIASLFDNNENKDNHENDFAGQVSALRPLQQSKTDINNLHLFSLVLICVYLATCTFAQSSRFFLRQEMMECMRT